MNGPRYDLIHQNNADSEAARLRYELRLSEEQYQAEAKHAIKLEKEVKRLRDRIQHALDDLTEFNDKGMAVRVLRDALSPQAGGESDVPERS